MTDIIAFGLLALAVVFVAVPLLRRRFDPVNSIDQMQENTALYREQEAALQLQLKNREIDQQQYDELCAEQQRLLLMDTTGANNIQQAPSTSGRWVLLIIAFALLPALAFSIYSSLGATPDMEITELLNKRAKAATRLEDEIYRTRLISRIEARLKDKPDHPGYQVTQARLLTEVGQYTQAANHYRRAMEMFPEDALITSEYAQVEYFAAESRFTPNVIAAMEKTIALDPHNSTVLGLQGVQAFEEKDYRRAITNWQAALRGVTPGTMHAQSLQSGIARASEALGEPLPGISVDVSLSPAMQAFPDQVLYVFAREAGARSAPVAVVRLQVSDLPTTVLLDDSTAMPGGKPLSSSGKVQVVARVSSSGGVTAKPGDLEAKSGIISLADGPQKISLVIDQAIPATPRQQGISVDVSLSPGLQISPEQVLFVYAKEVGERPMPLAVARLSAAELPTTVQLDDSMAMPGGKALSLAEQVQVVARVSSTGTAAPAPGDLVGESSPVTLGGELQKMKLVIDTTLP